MNKNTPIVEILNDKIAIYNSNNSEIIMWDVSEWLEDPNVIISIASAINFAHVEGAAALIETLHPGYLEGLLCPKCFSDDITTKIVSRENACNQCGLKFPIPEEEARGNEDEGTRYALCQLTLDAQVKAYIDFLRFAEDMGHDHSHTFTEFQETSNLNSWKYSPAGQLI